ncbi:MAG: hypothetical protein P8170_19585 [Gemmatimonadota bacterium]
MTRWVIAVGVVAAGFVGVVGPSPAAAQVEGGWAVGAQGGVGLFVGNGSDFLDGGPSLDVTVSRSVAPFLRIRADGALALLDDQKDPFEAADNRILLFGLGPEAHLDLGAIGLYVRGLVGRAAAVQVRTNSVLEERTTWTWVYGGGAGVRVRLSSALFLDAGGDVFKLGELDFARTASSSLALMEDPGLLRLRAGVWLAIG